MNTELKKVLSNLNKKYGQVITKGMKCVEKIPTGIISIDRLLEGGFPKGRFSMIYGAKSTGKSSLCGMYAAQIQNKYNGDVLIMDLENSWDPKYSKELGMNPDKVYYVRPKTIEEMGTIVNDFASHVSLIIVDSITAVSPKQELNRELEDDTMALTARKLSQFFRMSTPVVGKSSTIVLFVNQIRTSLGLYSYETYGGGHALSHYTSIILKMYRGKKADNPTIEIDKKKKEIGFNLGITVEKTKVSSTEGQKAMLNYYFAYPHFRVEDDLFKIAVIDGIIKRAGGGGWYSFGDEKIQGSDAFIQKIHDDKKLFDEIKKEVLK